MFRHLGLVVAAAVLLLAPVVQAAPPVDAYGALPSVEMTALAPSGNRYALAGTIGGMRRLLVIENGKTIVNIGLGDEKIRDLGWAGDDRVLITSSKTYQLQDDIGGRHEIAHVAIANVTTKKVVFALASSKANNGVWGQYGVHEIDGKWYGWFGGLTMSGPYIRGGPELYKVDLDTGSGTRVAGANENGASRTWLVGDRGEILARSETVGYGRWRLYMDEKKRIDVEDKDFDYGFGGRGRAPGSILYSAKEGDAAAWYELPAGGGEAERLFVADDKTGLIHDPWTSLLVGHAINDGSWRYTFYSPIYKARLEIVSKAFKDQDFELKSWSRDFEKAIVFTQGGQDSGSYFIIDFKTKRADAIGYSYPDVAPNDVGPVTMVTYKASDGLEIEAVLTLPPGPEKKNLPMVMLPHGGPHARDYVGFDWMAQAFASRGYAVLQPNFRGSDGYGKAFREAAKGEWGGKMQTDLSDGIAYLAGEGIIDPERVCIFGASYGGYAALAGVTLYNGLYKCAVSYAGVTDVAAIAAFDGDYYSDSSHRYWREYIGDGKAKRELSPTKLAAKADAPILLIHGKDDSVVPFDQSEAMERALRRASKPVEMITLKGEDHWLSTGSTRTTMIKAAVAFVEKHNPADPPTAEQAAR